MNNESYKTNRVLREDHNTGTNTYRPLLRTHVHTAGDTAIGLDSLATRGRTHTSRP